jgi:hypothetical protein
MVIKDSKKARLDVDFGKTTIPMATINIMKTKVLKGSTHL